MNLCPRIALAAGLLAMLLSLSFPAAAECVPGIPLSLRVATNGHAETNCVIRERSSRVFDTTQPGSSAGAGVVANIANTNASAISANHWSLAASSLSAAGAARASGITAADRAQETPYESGVERSVVERSIGELPWADSHDWVHNPPAWVQDVRNYKKHGMPIVHLMESKQTVIALGMSNHGKPGLYFTRKLPF